MSMVSEVRMRCVSGSLALAAILTVSAAGQTAVTNPSTASVSSSSPVVSSAARQALVANYGKLPLSFEANQGQADKQVRFLARGSGYGLSLTRQEAVLSLHASDGAVRGGKDHRAEPQMTPGKVDVIRMQLSGSNPDAREEGVDLLPGKVNYFSGKDASRWKTNIPTYSKVKFAGVYPGVDLVYYGNQTQLEYDFLVAPQADPDAIRLHFDGASKTALTADGDLSVFARDGKIAFHKPVIYQEVNGQRRMVDGRFTLMAHNSVGFQLGHYDHALPLVIDPVLAYSTFLGSDYTSQMNAIAVDAEGNAYLTGYFAADYAGVFPVTPGAFETTYYCPCNEITAFVTKLNPTGTALVYSTYLGGSYTDYGQAIAVDSAGNAYIGGQTLSYDFPVTTGAFQTTKPSQVGGAGNGFITKLNPTGSALIYSTYLGGSTGEGVNGLTIDEAGNAYAVGSTYSTNFPVTAGAFQTVPPGQSSAFVTKLNPSGSALVYSTYLGGPWPAGTNLNTVQGPASSAGAIVVDDTGNAYVAGTTYSVAFPVTPNAFQTTNAGAANRANNAFVTKLNQSGSGVIYSTYLGGSGLSLSSCDNVCGDYYGDEANALAVDSSGNAYVAGSAYSLDFPMTVGAFESGPPPSYSVSGFVTKLNPNGTGLLYSTYLGSQSGAAVSAIAVNAQGEAYVAGSAYPGFPTTANAYQTSSPTQGSFFGPTLAGYLAVMSPGGGSLLYATYLGGNGGGIYGTGDEVFAVAVDSSENVYLAGETASSNFPVTPNAFQSGLNSQYTSGFVSKLNIGPFYGVAQQAPPPMLAPQSGAYTYGQTLTISDAIPSATIRYTTDGSVPTTKSALYSGPILISNASETVNAIAISTGDAASNVTSATYTLVAAPPVFSPAPGKPDGPVTVTLTDITPGAVIHCTVNGTTPTSASPVCGQISIPSGYEKIEAVAISSGYAQSLVVSGIYSILTQTPEPVLSLPSGPYPAGQMLTITDADATATIRYTTDGSAPTTKSTLYRGPIVLTGSETIQAIAVSTGSGSSNAAIASYTTTP